MTWLLIAVSILCIAGALVLQGRRHGSSRKLDPADVLAWHEAWRKGEI